jgi:hypothetical protein
MIILVFNRLGLAGNLRRVHEGDIKEAMAYMAGKKHHGRKGEDSEGWCGVMWGIDEVEQLSQEDVLFWFNDSLWLPPPILANT